MIYLALLLLLLLSFLLSGIESALLSVSRVRVRHAAEAGDRRATRLHEQLEDRDALLGAVTVANHLTNLGAFLILAWKILSVSDIWSYAAAILISLPIFLIGIEVIPKKLFRRYPFRSLRRLVWLIRIVGLARPLFRAFRLPTIHEQKVAPSSSAGRDDLARLADSLRDQGQISPGASGLIQRVLGYRSLSTADLMEPLHKGIAVASDVPLGTALILARENKVDTLPVLSEKGDFVGILEIDSLPARAPSDRQVRQHMRVLETVRASDPALRSVQWLRRKGREVAVVVDESREPIGLAHADDLIAPLLHGQAAP